MKILLCIILLVFLASCNREAPQTDENETQNEDYSDYSYEEYETQEDEVNEETEIEEPEIEEAAEPAEGIHGLLSVVQYGDNRVYILGSIHIGREEWFPLTLAAEAAIERADIFAFEIDMAAEGGRCLCDPAYCDCGCDPYEDECICFAMEMMFFPEGETLLTFLPPEDYKALMASLRTFPINLDVVATFRPTTLAEIILYQIVAPNLGLSADHSIDTYVFNRAQELERPVIGLTDFNDHIAFVSNMPEEYQFATARYFSDFDTMLEETEELVLVYEAQDIETLKGMVRLGLAEAYEAYAVGEISAGGLGLSRYWHYTVGNYRSNFFARQIADLLTQTEEPTTFFVTVGIAHLTREENVFDSLREMGFTVERLYR